MLSGRRRHPHFSAKYSADMNDQFCTHCRTPSIIRQTCPAASNIWRALSRLAHPTSKKGTSIATSAHFAAVRGVLCVQCFRFMSSSPFLFRYQPAQSQSTNWLHPPAHEFLIRVQPLSFSTHSGRYQTSWRYSYHASYRHKPD